MRLSATTRTLMVAGFLMCASVGHGQAIPVELKEVDGRWQLLRGGEPYRIRGVGGDGSLERLAAAGANSVRTWSTDELQATLDAAHALGMTVSVGLWLEHERHGFDYGDPEMVQAQLAEIREAVLRYKDHPAVLIWGVGNEMEEYGAGDDPRIWTAVNEVAEMIKALDPYHPTMTVTAELGGGRIEMVHRHTPAIDIHGINAYGGAASLARRLREAGASKPYIVTEFGPIGPWESETTPWGAPFEQTSTQKADFYRQTWQQAVLDNPDMALGGYAFLWGTKMEGTATWFGMLLDDGAKLGVVDVMTELWSGAAPADLAPRIEPIAIDGGLVHGSGCAIDASVTAVDPEGDAVSLHWALRPESGDYATGGDLRAAIPDIEGAILAADGATVRVRLPDEPGAYRLFVYARDPAGNAATANLPLKTR